MRDKQRFSFLALGDMGTGGKGQLKLRDGMARVLSEKPVDFGLLLGDLFYQDGITSPSDPAFDRLFKNVYTEPVFAFPFFPALGNHDYHGNAAAVLTLGRRDIRWRMPARRYVVKVPVGDSEALFVALDTTPIDNPSRVTPDLDVRPPLEGVAEALSAASGAAWRFAFGHHLLRSSGVHAKSEPMLREAAPVLAAGWVDVYFCGHDHIIEALDPIAGVAQIVSGGGGGSDRPYPIRNVLPESRFRKGGAGFVRCDVDVTQLVCTFHDEDGSLLFTHVVKAREKAPSGGA